MLSPKGTKGRVRNRGMLAGDLGRYYPFKNNFRFHRHSRLHKKRERAAARLQEETPEQRYTITGLNGYYYTNIIMSISWLGFHRMSRLVDLRERAASRRLQDPLNQRCSI